ncbi:hypothetical protein ACFYQA_11730 [Streptomyces sp. NPDC005774]|uniref:hypothetical protein n=1 Tax=Streptomyces sp. NPDC005774 TaxID=3364728 RepID=UPI0036BFE7D6
MTRVCRKVRSGRGRTASHLPYPGFNVNGLGTRTAVLLPAGAGGTDIAFLRPAVGGALLVGLAVVALLHNLLR